MATSPMTQMARLLLDDGFKKEANPIEVASISKALFVCLVERVETCIIFALSMSKSYR